MVSAPIDATPDWRPERGTRAEDEAFAAWLTDLVVDRVLTLPPAHECDGYTDIGAESLSHALGGVVTVTATNPDGRTVVAFTMDGEFHPEPRIIDVVKASGLTVEERR